MNYGEYAFYPETPSVVFSTSSNQFYKTSEGKSKMIDLKQFEGIESSPWIFKTEEAGFQCVNFQLVTSSEINFGKCGIEIELFSDGSNGCFPVPEKTKEMLLIEKAPELLKEVQQLRSMIDSKLFNSEEERTVLQTVMEENRVLKKQFEELMFLCRELLSSALDVESDYPEVRKECFDNLSNYCLDDE